MAAAAQNGYAVDSDTGYISSREFQDMVEAFLSGPFDAAYEILYSKVAKIVAIKCSAYVHGADLEDLSQEVNLRLFKLLNPIIDDPMQFFSRDGRKITEDDLGKCFYNYVQRIAINLLREKHKENIETVSIDQDESGGFFESLRRDEKLLADSIVELEDTLGIYRLCLVTLFKLKSKPYIILGFCFNILIYGAEAEHAQRGRSSYTAEAIADKLLGGLRDEFCKYHARYLRPVPDDAIAPFDARLLEEYEGKAYKLHITKTFYGSNPEKSIADWTYSTRRSLLHTLAKEQETIANRGVRL